MDKHVQNGNKTSVIQDYWIWLGPLLVDALENFEKYHINANAIMSKTALKSLTHI